MVIVSANARIESNDFTVCLHQKNSRGGCYSGKKFLHQQWPEKNSCNWKSPTPPIMTFLMVPPQRYFLFVVFSRGATTSQPLIRIVSSLTSLMLQIKVCVGWNYRIRIPNSRTLVFPKFPIIRTKPSLYPRRNLTPIRDVCEAPISLFWASNGFNELPEVRFEFPFILFGKSTMAFFYWPDIATIQILVHRWRPRTRISTLFRRWT